MVGGHSGEAAVTRSGRSGGKEVAVTHNRHLDMARLGSRRTVYRRSHANTKLNHRDITDIHNCNTLWLQVNNCAANVTFELSMSQHTFGHSGIKTYADT